MSFECIKPGDNGLTSLDKKVYILVHKYQAIKTPRTVIHLSKTPGYRELFNHVFEYHIGLIKTRSQSFEDGQITVYDKALLILTNNGSSLSHFGAIELFKDEILGIRKDDDMGRLDALFSKNIALRAILGHVTGWRKETALDHALTDATTPIFGNKQTSYQQQGMSDPLTPSPSASIRELHQSLANMFIAFATAQLEHARVKSTKTAKLVGDSAENLLRHLRDHDPTHYMIPVLKQASRMAQGEMGEINRGKKRSLDMSDKGTVDYSACRRSRSSGRCSTSVDKPRVSRRRRRGIRGQADCYRP